MLRGMDAAASQTEEPSIPVPRSLERLQATTGIIGFGSPQTIGHELEVSHWTMTWREDVIAERYRGEMTLIVWGNDYSGVADIARQTAGRLAGSRELLKTAGFDSMSGSFFGTAYSGVFDPLA